MNLRRLLLTLGFGLLAYQPQGVAGTYEPYSHIFWANTWERLNYQRVFRSLVHITGDPDQGQIYCSLMHLLEESMSPIEAHDAFANNISAIAHSTKTPSEMISIAAASQIAAETTMCPDVRVK